MDNRKGIFKKRLTVESLCGCITSDKIFMEHQNLLIRNKNFNIESYIYWFHAMDEIPKPCSSSMLSMSVKEQ